MLPFDGEMYKSSINILGEVIAKFIVNNYKNRRILSFVDNKNGGSTHGEMLDIASELLVAQGIVDVKLERFYKKENPREAPLEYILSKITR